MPGPRDLEVDNSACVCACVYVCICGYCGRGTRDGCQTNIPANKYTSANCVNCAKGLKNYDACFKGSSSLKEETGKGPSEE